jgi:6-phosphogluconolactonase
MEMKPEIHIFDSPTETVCHFGKYFILKAEASAQFNVALSGGSTPRLLFDFLAESYKSSQIWQKIHFYWGDERCVSPEHSESNYKMAKDHLLHKINIPQQNIHRMRGEEPPEAEAKRYSAEITANLRINSGLPVFDLIILGLGEDGHTASIFPQQMDLLNSEDICAGAQHPVTKQKRLTLTGKVINASVEMAFLVTGDSKKTVLAEIINKSGNWKNYPAAYINPISSNLKWFVDKSAAQLL